MTETNGNGERNSLTYEQKAQVEAYLKLACKRNNEGFAEYRDGWDDHVTAEKATALLGFEVTSNNVRGIRSKIIGNMRNRSSNGVAEEAPVPVPAPREMGASGSTMHSSTFQYLKPTPAQINSMDDARAAFMACARAIEALVPPGADRMYIRRRLREVAMWVNIAITRNADGSPRE